MQFNEDCCDREYIEQHNTDAPGNQITDHNIYWREFRTKCHII